MKMNKKRPILRRAAIPAVLALLCTLFWFGKPNDFGLGRNMELLVNMMRELSLFYVDEVDPDQLMQDAAEGMTRNLDPYTEFLPEEQMSNFDLLTTGKYGGIGSMIRKKGDYVISHSPTKAPRPTGPASASATRSSRSKARTPRVGTPHR